MSSARISCCQFPRILLFLFVATLALFQEAQSQVANSSRLYKALAATDSLLFERGFNKCDLSLVEILIHEELEFFHDKSGRENRSQFLQGFRRNICSNAPSKPIRKLVPGSMQVYSLKNNGEIYGAIQKGEHRFYLREPGKDLIYTTSARFSHVWILVNDRWKLKTALSYDHGN